MRPVLSRLRQWNPDELYWCATELGRRSEDLQGVVGLAATRTRDTDWTGVAADAARDRSERERATAAVLADGWRGTADALRLGASALGEARELALTLADEASGVLGLVVDDAGRVTAPPLGWAGSSLPATMIRLTLAVVARDHDARLGAALDAVDAADRALAAALGAVGDPDPEPVRPPDGAGPDAAARYWAALSDGQRRRVLAEHPDWVGNLDGIPAAARDTANRAVLAADRRGLQGAVDDLRARGADTFPATPATLVARELRSRLADIDALERAAAEPGRSLLVYRGGDEIRAAVAVGDVDTADHVAVYTPGVNTSVDDLPAKVNELAGLRADAVTQLASANADDSVATVVWLDYVPPQLSPSTPLDSLVDVVVDLGAGVSARDGADALAGFCRGIVASRPDDVHLTAIGHSYGSTTTGLALRSGNLGVDDAVFLGSPGLGTNSIGDLGLADGHVYVAEADGDVIADLAAFGADPNHLSGAVGLSTAAQDVDGRPFTAASGHSDYLTDGGTSRHNIAAVVAGLRENIVVGTDLDGGDILSRSPFGRLLDLPW